MKPWKCKFGKQQVKSQLNDKMQGVEDVRSLADSVIDQMCHYVGAEIGAVYVVENDTLNFGLVSYAYHGENRP